MKKLFTTIFILLYVVSTFGINVVQHYCNTMQKSVDVTHDQCCCSYDAATQACDIDMKTSETQSCCAHEQPSQNDGENAIFTVLTSPCCETHHAVKNVDATTLSQHNDVTQDFTDVEINVVDQTNKNWLCVEQDSLDYLSPSQHLNLPLLI